ncbi:Mth938-like domain-containing protein [Diaphorobacter sp.]|uniref:Mth938-like domain-containing protein n=1 Tax=Diaphorobacter sp. TaxID=1934310 RepID=UPI003D1445D9
MKFQPDRSDVQTITGYGSGWIGVDTDKVYESIIIGSQGQRIAWQCSRFEDLTAAHFAQLAELDAEVVIFGSGLRNRFPPPAWLQPLMARRTGLETMDTQAACRTYNILAVEGRNVVAALLLESQDRP